MELGVDALVWPHPFHNGGSGHVVPRLSVLQATECWVGSENEASHKVHSPKHDTNSLINVYTKDATVIHKT